MSSLNDLVQCDYTANSTSEPRVLEAVLGDGYHQRAADGINSMPQVWSLTWTNRSYLDIDAIENFFIALGGHTSFDWIPLRATTALKFTASSWTRSYNEPENDSFSVNIKQSWEY